MQGAEGSLDQFSRGYDRFGFTKDEEDGTITYREWIPSAKEASLVGEFNNWDTNAHKMAKGKFGVFCVQLPAGECIRQRRFTCPRSRLQRLGGGPFAHQIPRALPPLPPPIDGPARPAKPAALVCPSGEHLDAATRARGSLFEARLQRARAHPAGEGDSHLLGRWEQPCLRLWRIRSARVRACSATSG